MRLQVPFRRLDASLMEVRHVATSTGPRCNLVEIVIRAGQLPPAEDNDLSYLKNPLNAL